MPTTNQPNGALMMRRREFLKLPIAAAALAAMPRGALGDTTVVKRAGKGSCVRAQKDRDDQELLIMGGRFDLKVSSRDTGGDLCIYDTVRSSKGGPALHRHHAQDEWFYVIRGKFIAQVGKEDRKSTRLNSSHMSISYAVFCLKKK